MITKSEIVKLQKRVDSKKAKGGDLDALGSTLGHGVAYKGKKDKKTIIQAVKNDNWIGSEDDFQIAVAKILDASGLDWFHVPNGGKRNAREGAKFKKMGVKAGVPDVLILNPTRFGHVGLCIELKVGRNTMTEKQHEWKEVLMGSRWAYFLCYGISDIQQLLKMHYKL